MQKQYYRLQDFCQTTLPLAVWDEQHVLINNTQHQHDCIEIMFVYCGSGLCGIGSELYPLKSGSMYVILKGETHKYRSDPGMHFFNIMFAPEFFSTPEEQLLYTHFVQKFEKIKVVTFNAEVQKFMFQLLKRLKTTLETQSKLAEFGARILFLEFLFYIQSTSFQTIFKQSINRKEMLLSRIYDYVEQHYQKKITLNMVSHALQVSPEYTGKLFKSCTGIDFSRYVSRFRLEKSIEALNDDNQTIQEIAFQNGFYDTAYYIKSFKKLYGITPHQYRMKNQASI